MNIKLSDYINIPSLFLSSKDNGNLSLTLKGTIIYLITLYLLKNGYTADETVILGFANELVNLGSWLVAIFGVGRKVYFLGKELLGK